MMKSRATQKRYFWNYLEIQNHVILLMNKTSRLKNTLINLRVVFRFVVRRKWLHHSPLLIRSQTSVHLAVNGFSDFMRPREGLFPPNNWMFRLLESVSGFHASTENRFLAFIVK